MLRYVGIGLVSVVLACGGAQSDGEEAVPAPSGRDRRAAQPANGTEPATTTPQDGVVSPQVAVGDQPTIKPVRARTPPPKSEPKTALAPAEPTAEELARCATAQDKLIEIGRKIDKSVYEDMRSKREVWIGKCKERVKAGDLEFRDDVECVAEAHDLDTLIRCDGWTDWPGM